MPASLTILVVHNHYQQRGGEDSVFETECAMLEAAGHTVIRYTKHNDEIGAPAQGSGVRVQGLANTRDQGLGARDERRQANPSDSPAPGLGPKAYGQTPSSNPADQRQIETLIDSETSPRAFTRNPFRAFLCFSWLKKLSLFSKTFWNRTIYRETTEIIKREKPDIVHCHNTFPLISPSVYWAAAKQGVPVVQTLHNYRLICINPYLYRGGRICEACLGRSPLRGVIHRCYRNSFSASFTVAAMLMIHRLLGTYRNKVTTYIALTEFGRKKFLEARLCDPEKVVVKPNAVAAEAVPAEVLGTRYQVLANTQSTSKDSPEALAPSRYSLAAEHGRGGTTTVLYVGRLSPEKGVDILIAAWKLFLAQSNQQPTTSSLDQQEDRNDSPASQLVPSTYPLVPSPSPAATLVPSTYHLVPKAQPRLHIIGDGPERAKLQCMAEGHSEIIFFGSVPHDQIASHMRSATALVLPTRCYEMFAITPLEAMQIGLPVILSDSAATGSLVEDDATGFTFRSGSAESLAEALAKALSDPERLAEMGHHAQARFLASDCPPSHNLSALENVYTLAMKG